MDHRFRARLLAGEQLVGPIVSLAAPEVAEILAGLGFDWLFVDAEHAPLDIGQVQTLLQAACPACPCLVRVPAGDKVWMAKALDVGASGVIVPQIHTAEQAEEVVRLCKYPPRGTRGVGVARAQGYGSGLIDYLSTANESIAVVIQAESVEAVRNMASITRVSGIDAVFLGPYDLSASLGKPGQFDDPEFRDAISRVTDICLDAGVKLGVFGVDVAAVQPYLDSGYSLITVGIDVVFLSQGARSVLSALGR